MGPVSFQRVGAGLDRAELLNAAKRLTTSGIRVHAVDENQGILIRSEDVGLAEDILD